VEINFMGYADTAQVGSGLRQRLYSRAFIIGDVQNPSSRFVYLVLDTATGDTAIRYGILRALASLGGDYALYSQQNVAVTGTHSHSGPGAWLNYLLPQITSKGFDKQSYQAIVDGAVLSIKRAHESLAPGYLSYGNTKVAGANINRSLYAYLANPPAERARYNASSEDDGSVEKDLTLLRFSRTDGRDIGALTWFPTHGTSMLGNNTLVSGDNKGVAAYLFEQSMGAGFVAGFSQANVGDTSPNVLGAWCEDGSGQMCSFESSTCADGKSQMCHARGPFFRVKDNGASSCFEIGRRQFEAARNLLASMQNGAGTPVVGGSVKAFHTFNDMSHYTFDLPNGTTVRTCPAALGYSFAAGTSDGPGAFDFTQGDSGAPNASPLWRVVSGILKEPSASQRACHAPKPILLDVGEITTPYLWTPNVVDVQAFRAGQFVILVSPGEATTMAGRRWKEAVAQRAAELALAGPAQPMVVIGGPANTYTHYITTREEYGVQRYEGASTLYGQWTLDAYIGLTLANLPLLGALSSAQPSPGPLPPDNSETSLSFITGVVYDSAPLFRRFGDVTTDVAGSYAAGAVVEVVFVGANPRNNLRLEGTYVAVEKWDGAAGTWVRVRDDGDWSLVFHWKRTEELLGWSEARVVWESEQGERGRYRIRYFGDWKALGGRITGFEGVSGEFLLV
jgi:neutral ceramidase